MAKDIAYPYDEKELTGSVILCAENGNLLPESRGWSRRPLHTCNLSGHWLRKKRWNYWCITTPECLFSVTLSNLDYMGLAFAYFLDFKTNQFTEQTVMCPFGAGCDLPDTVSGEVKFEHNDMQLLLLDDGRQVHIQASSPAFGGKEMQADLFIQRPVGHETLNVVIPWSENRFQFTSKQNCLPARGEVRIGERKYTVKAEDGAFACLDFGRGIWKYSSFWNWASFSANVGEDRVGVNLGAGWTDGSGMTENGIFLNGKVTKLSEDVAFQYDPQNFMKPWALKSTVSQRVDLRFAPFYERIAATNFVVLTSEVHQMIGRFSGRLTDDAGRVIEIRDQAGWAEEHRARW
jgi:hypothetical protein